MAKATNSSEKETKPKGIVSTVFLVAFALITLISFVLLPIVISLALFILVLFPVLLYLILGKLTKRWGLSVVYTLLIQIILLGILGFYVYTDTKAFTNNLQTQPKYILYQEGDNIILGYALNSFDFDKFVEQNQTVLKALSSEDVKQILNNINQKDKFVIILNSKFFDPLPETIDIEMEGQTLNLPKSSALEILKSDAPEDIILKYAIQNSIQLQDLPPEILEQVQQGNLPSQLKQYMETQMPFDKTLIKPATLAVLTSKVIESQGLEYVFTSLKDNILQVKPFYISLWALKNMPVKEVSVYLPQGLQQNMQGISGNQG